MERWLVWLGEWGRLRTSGVTRGDGGAVPCVGGFLAAQWCHDEPEEAGARGGGCSGGAGAEGAGG